VIESGRDSDGTGGHRRAVCVGICTRDRGRAIVDTLESVIAAAESVIPRPEILVVDQSEGNETRHAIVALVEGGQVRYIPTSTVGLSPGELDRCDTR
jgi:hypothetical protein